MILVLKNVIARCSGFSIVPNARRFGSFFFFFFFVLRDRARSSKRKVYRRTVKYRVLVLHCLYFRALLFLVT